MADLGPKGKRWVRLYALADFVKSACWRREYFGGAHRPVRVFLWGRKGFGSWIGVSDADAPSLSLLAKAESSLSRNAFTVRKDISLCVCTRQPRVRREVQQGVGRMSGSDRGRSFRFQPPATDMFSRHVASRPAVLVRQRTARTVPLAATWTSTLGRRDISRLSRSSSRISTVFGALLAVGIATTGYGLCVHSPSRVEDNVPIPLNDPTIMFHEDTNSTLPSLCGPRRLEVTCVLV